MVPSESDDNLRLEIGHVLFIDIVGYSKLLNEEQKERLNQLIEIVLRTNGQMPAVQTPNAQPRKHSGPSIGRRSSLNGRVRRIDERKVECKARKQRFENLDVKFVWGVRRQQVSGSKGRQVRDEIDCLLR